MDEEYDIIIVGGGPAGTLTAKMCAAKGLKVLVLEKKPEIGAPKRCAEGIGHLDLLRAGYTGKERFIAQTIDGAIVYVPNGAPIELPKQPGGGYILERKVFDKFLAYDAAKAGAKIYTKAEVFDLLWSGGKIAGAKVLYNGEQKDIYSKIIIAADGVESKIPRIAGLPSRNTPRTIESGYQYEMANIDIKDPHKIHTYLGNEIAPRGYIWIFPKGSHIANVGIGINGSDGKTAKYYLDKWISSKPGIKKGSIIEENSGGIPIGGFLESMTTDNFLTIGDAAHQVNPIHGGGLAETSFSAEIAAKVIIDAIKLKDTSNKTLDRYNKLWWEKRGNNLKKTEKILHVLEKVKDSDINLAQSSFHGQDILDLTGGKTHKLIKILINNPKLATLIKYLK
ncbi:MAG: NAD(P)/FAD-dependent oxidoreductase [Candidatus Nanohalarchaeota archaeon]|nr:MAG: NAD(P)/FAD-dependent oxidoreductase [Candidatus Nanohaloarchaeota archaeon]